MAFLSIFCCFFCSIAFLNPFLIDQRGEHIGRRNSIFGVSLGVRALVIFKKSAKIWATKKRREKNVWNWNLNKHISNPISKPHFKSHYEISYDNPNEIPYHMKPSCKNRATSKIFSPTRWCWAERRPWHSFRCTAAAAWQWLSAATIGGAMDVSQWTGDGGFKYFLFSPLLGGRFRWVETTNQLKLWIQIWIHDS